MMTEAEIVAGMPTALLLSIKEDIKGRNLRDYRDHATRWTAMRLKSINAELRTRKKSR